jgi:hypothetical protein
VGDEPTRFIVDTVDDDIFAQLDTHVLSTGDGA